MLFAIKHRKSRLNTEHDWPKIQVALDFTDLNQALRVARMVYQGGADWLEAGTPLIKSVGMGAVEELKKKYPDATIIADLKTLDTGWIETEMAAEAGADIVSISGLANNRTVTEAVRCAKKHRTRIMGDLLEVPNLIRRAAELKKLGVNYVCVHTGIDAQKDQRNEIDRKALVIGRLAKSVRLPIAAAGGIEACTAWKVVRAGAKIVIVGTSVTRATDPKRATTMIWAAISRSS